MAAIVSGSEYLQLPRPKNTWIIDHVLATGGNLMLYGDPKVGKSLASLQLALAIVEGTDWLGMKVNEVAGRPVYVQLDSPRSLWAERIEIIRDAGHDIDRILLTDREILDTFPFNILDPQHYMLLAEALREIQPTPPVVIIDTLKEASQVPENDNTEMQKVVAALENVCRPSAMVLVHHASKPKEYGQDVINGARGASYVNGRMDTIMRFSKKSVHFIGRALEEGTVRTTRDPATGFWLVKGEEEVNPLVAEVLADDSLTTLLAKAKVLSLRNGRSVEACRSILRRSMKEVTHEPNPVMDELVG